MKGWCRLIAHRVKAQYSFVLSSPPPMTRSFLTAFAVCVLALPAQAQSLLAASDAITFSERRTCATTEADPALAREANALIARRQIEHPSAAAAVTIPVAFHVIYTQSRRSTEGNVPQSWITAQMNVLNAAYAGSGYSFTLASVDRTNNSRWFTASYGSRNELDMKAALAISPATTLNVYTTKPGQGLLGWATFPWDYPETSTRHGVVVHYGTLPGGGLAPYNIGDTGTHEVGHYLGLYHTFQGGCGAPGDYVSDTPPEATPAFGCPIGRNTCTAPGSDPIKNFMDYTDDACMNSFTAGQRSRMKNQWAAYRA